MHVSPTILPKVLYSSVNTPDQNIIQKRMTKCRCINSYNRTMVGILSESSHSFDTPHQLAEATAYYRTRRARHVVGWGSPPPNLTWQQMWQLLSCPVPLGSTKTPSPPRWLHVYLLLLMLPSTNSLCFERLLLAISTRDGSTPPLKLDGLASLISTS